eukprot:12898582-Prorocentrum_lima.AAC.1
MPVSTTHARIVYGCTCSSATRTGCGVWQKWLRLIWLVGGLSVCVACCAPPMSRSKLSMLRLLGPPRVLA